MLVKTPEKPQGEEQAAIKMGSTMAISVGVICRREIDMKAVSCWRLSGSIDKGIIAHLSFLASVLEHYGAANAVLLSTVIDEAGCSHVLAGVPHGFVDG